MTAAKIILCEQIPRWAAALRSIWGDEHLPLNETRSLAHCEQSLVQAPLSLMAIDITAVNFVATLQWISRVGRRFPQARWVALTCPELMPGGPLLREAGALDVLHSTLEIPRLARLARRHLQLVPAADSDLDSWVAQQMPWPAFASGKAVEST